MSKITLRTAVASVSRDIKRMFNFWTAHTGLKSIEVGAECSFDGIRCKIISVNLTTPSFCLRPVLVKDDIGDGPNGWRTFTFPMGQVPDSISVARLKHWCGLYFNYEEMILHSQYLYKEVPCVLIAKDFDCKEPFLCFRPIVPADIGGGPGGAIKVFVNSSINIEKYEL